MADAVVSAIVETIVGNLSSAVGKEIGLLWGLEDELNSLERTFNTIRLALPDAEIKQRNNPAMQEWLKNLKDAAYDTENILDEMATERLKREADAERGMSCFCLSNHLAFRFKMAHKVKNIKEKLSGIAKERDQFNLSEGVKESRFGVTLESRETNSTVNESEIFGREKEKEMIIKKLLDSALDQSDLSVYTICGMGGLGKTTLAQMVYNDDKMERHFELRIWVCVSNDFNIKRLVRAILEFIDKGGCDISELETLKSELQERLGGKIFLLVLDDVWNEKHTLWDQLKEILKCGLKGSVLVITTRNEKIASMISTIGTHHIGHLNDEDSWFLFEQRALSTRKVEENLVAIGKAIVRKCGGVPLAIKALGSLMQFKYDESEWLAIEKNEIWQLSDNENGILSALRLSYDNLLPHMRQCFAYCCLFPKGYEMEEEELIQLWMANGFVSYNNQKGMFLNGCLIFKELSWRSFFQDFGMNDLGRKTCKMHDLMHDLATSVMRHETYILQNREVQAIPKTVRHLSYLEPVGSITKRKRKAKLQIDTSLRSFIILEEYDYSDNVCYSILSNQQYIRALKIFDTWFKNLSNLVCKLKHLRYLYMSCRGMESLPESLTRLCNLQTLKLVESYLLMKLPKNLKVMKNLWFLELDNFDSLICTPPGLRELSYLIRLSIFIVGEGVDEKIDQLKELKLSGSLSIRGLNNVRNLEEAKSANLMGKKNLTSLSLCWSDNLTNESPEHCEEVLQGLEPHQGLQDISINYYQGTKFSDWMLNWAFEKLESISLQGCPRCECLPPMGKLPYLESVRLLGMESVKRLGAEWHGDAECSFPALTELKIYDMPNLEEWSVPADSIAFPALPRLKINNMPNLEEWSIPADSMESFSSLTELSIERCPKLDRIPSLGKLPYLKRVHLWWMESMKRLGAEWHGDAECSFPALTLLQIEDMPNLEEWSVPADSIESFSSLTNLTILVCPKLDRIPSLGKLPCLKHVHLCRMESVKRLGVEWHGDAECSFSALTHLQIDDMTNLEEWSVPADSTKSFSSLIELTIHGCPKLDRIPFLPALRTLFIYDSNAALVSSITCLTTLEELTIWVSNIRALPNTMGNLSSLKRLYVEDCPNLEFLCEGLTCLNSLEWLDIDKCPQLEKRCEKPHGEDWPKISHIPNIRINGQYIQVGEE